MPTLWVTHDEDDRFTVSVRNHELAVDQPSADGGHDAGLSPVEMFVAGIAACVGHYARRYLHLHGLTEDPLAVSAHWTLAEHPARIGSMHFDLTLPADVSAERRNAAIAVAYHCTLHNTLNQPPDISIGVADVTTPAA
jgi:putative redox protein